MAMSPTQPLHYPAGKARGGEINLRAPWQRAVFIVGLVLPVVIALMLIVVH